MYLGTLGWWLLVLGRLISHFWMGTRLNKLSCLVPEIFSLILWICCRVCSYIHFLLATWLSVWISWCTWCAHLRRMCAGWLVLKNCEGAQINFCHGNMWWLNLYPYILSSLALIPIWSQISLCCCMLVITWNISSFIFCLGNVSHLQRKNTWLAPHFGSVWP